MSTEPGQLQLQLHFRLQGRREAESARWQSRRAAYSRLLAATGVVVHTADAFHDVMASRSGFGEAVDVALHVRRPIDVVDLHELLRPDTVALYEAMAEVATVGTAAAVRLGSEVVELCAEVMRAATRPGEGRSRIGAKLRSQMWTEEQLESRAAAVRSLQRARAEFAALARKELGIEIADAFALPNQAE